MSNSHLIMTLAKVIIAAAWADGEIQHEELNSLKDLLFALPELTAMQWAELDMYIEIPPTEAEQAFLLERLREAISSGADQTLAFEALENMLQADGTVTEGEQKIAETILQAIEAADTSIFGQFAGLIRGPIVRRSQTSAATYNREQYFDDFVKNKVYYAVRRRLDLGEADLKIADSVLRKLGLAGGLLAHIARASEGITQTEFDAIVNALQSGWNITTAEATVVAEVAIADESQNLDYFRATREFATLCGLEERKQFLDALFAVAVADGTVSYDEIGVIREVSISLKLPNQIFIEAKRKIPRDQRSE